MSAPQRPLFRDEAVRRRSGRLEGSVSLALPLGWQIVGLLLFVIVITAAAFLLAASYARTQTVPGLVSLDAGVASIMPSRSGVITFVGAKEGDEVLAGQVLARIRSEDRMLGGGAASTLMRDSLSEQDARLASQANHVRAAADAEAARLRAQMGGVDAEIRGLEEQIDDQVRLVEITTSEFEDLKSVADRGFISRRDLQTREATLISRRQQLAQLRQTRATRQAQLTETRRAIEENRSAAMAQNEAMASGRAALSQQLAQSDFSEGYTVTAPVAGTATGITMRLGQAASTSVPIMMVVPAGSSPMVELRAPTKAIGFIQAGQHVRLAIDAFPYERFGTVAATVESISSAAQVEGEEEPVYLIRLSVREPWIEAFGRRQPLLPGMTLTARITGERRSLMEWLLEPLFAVRGR
ncbi:MAG TPA: HlyD family efflux transporter periplasmic adaptor subunit [Brevundimonas sp.]|nr:HlyD family efflux transporter periplasmic adaptor subunit [Brevundimonas sp.]